MEVDVTVEGGNDFASDLLSLFDGNALIEAVAGAAYARWIELANEHLSGDSASTYINGIAPPTITGASSAVIKLEGDAAQTIENGTPGYDFRETHLKGRPWMRIPFPNAREADGRSSRFRTLSINSPPGTWIYPAKDGANLIEQLESELDAIASNVVQKVVDAVLGAGSGAAPQAAKRSGRGGRSAFAAAAIARVQAGISDAQLSGLRTGMRDLTTHREGYRGLDPNKVATGAINTANSRRPFDPIKIDVETRGNQIVKYHLVDGRHRLTAAREAGATRIRAEVTVTGPRGGVLGKRTVNIKIPK